MNNLEVIIPFALFILFFFILVPLFFIRLSISAFKNRKYKTIILSKNVTNDFINEAKNVESSRIDTVGDFSCLFLKENIFHGMVKNDSFHDSSKINIDRNKFPDNL